VSTVQVRVDNDLIERCIKGDEAAWRDLVKRYQRLVYSVAHVICRQSDDVSDVFQQVWLDLYQSLSDLRNVEALPAWLITVTKRRSYAMSQSRHNYSDRSMKKCGGFPALDANRT
jgi:RNA polymerase sigma factor (sigma-70 family)